MNQMLINVATRKFARSIRLPEEDVPGPAGAGLSKSAASRRFVALSAARLKDRPWKIRRKIKMLPIALSKPITTYNTATTSPPINWLLDPAPAIRFCSNAESIVGSPIDDRSVPVLVNLFDQFGDPAA